jgi:hypothetical protein
LLDEAKHEVSEFSPGCNNAVRHAALESAAISRADNQLTGGVGANLDFRRKANFSRARRFGKMQNFSARA